MSYYVIIFHVISCYMFFMLYHVVSCYSILYHVISCHSMLYHVKTFINCLTKWICPQTKTFFQIKLYSCLKPNFQLFKGRCWYLLYKLKEKDCEEKKVCDENIRLTTEQCCISWSDKSRTNCQELSVRLPDSGHLTREEIDTW